MTRLIAYVVILSLLSTSTAWAQASTEPTLWSQATKKKKATKSKRSRPAPQPVPAPSMDEEQAAPATPAEPMQPAQPMEAAPKQEPLAQDAPKQEPPAQTPTTDPDSMDFDLLEPMETAAAAEVDPELEKSISRRRTMLKLHQGLGFALVGGLAATTVVGQLQFNDSFRGGGDDRNLLGLHRGLAIGTAAIFATVGMLGVLAPEPFEKEFQWDTVTLHKIFMTVATVGMVAQVLLGIMATNRYGRLSERDLATAHQVVGYTTLGAVSAGVLTLFF
ncbi:hypothetical protein [Pyxidicoccus trucidator]|uniref:hypothetical protein n=1 Tax=Pyxidicoccus trucidator TaxID=2709662 RepID=UPI0013DD68A9|nr:hypothetical protein [Pyxidicoccus trucidator]